MCLFFVVVFFFKCGIIVAIPSLLQMSHGSIFLLLNHHTYCAQVITSFKIRYNYILMEVNGTTGKYSQVVHFTFNLN